MTGTMSVVLARWDSIEELGVSHVTEIMSVRRLKLGAVGKLLVDCLSKFLTSRRIHIAVPGQAPHSVGRIARAFHHGDARKRTAYADLLAYPKFLALLDAVHLIRSVKIEDQDIRLQTSGFDQIGGEVFCAQWGEIIAHFFAPDFCQSSIH